MPRIQRHINLAQYCTNLNQIREQLAPGVMMMSVIKANAYGHGSVPLAKASIQCGCHYLGVASSDEAKEIQEAGITHPILVLSELHPNHILDNVAFTLFSDAQIPILIQAAQKHRCQIKIHLKVDTHMHRLGILPEQVPEIIQTITQSPNLQLEGIYTHLSNTDSPSYCDYQYQVFNTTLAHLKQAETLPKVVHMTNSMGTQQYPNMHFNMVRIGLSAYKNVMTVTSHINSIKPLNANDTIGYDNAYTLAENAHIAVLEMGYADGLPMAASNGGHVIINEIPYPIIGKICMDMTLINLGSNSRHIQVGDTAILSPTILSTEIDMNLRELTCSFDRPRCALNITESS